MQSSLLRDYRRHCGDREGGVTGFPIATPCGEILASEIVGRLPASGSGSLGAIVLTFHLHRVFGEPVSTRTADAESSSGPDSCVTDGQGSRQTTGTLPGAAQATFRRVLRTSPSLLWGCLHRSHKRQRRTSTICDTAARRCRVALNGARNQRHHRTQCFAKRRARATAAKLARHEVQPLTTAKRTLPQKSLARCGGLP